MKFTTWAFTRHMSAKYRWDAAKSWASLKIATHLPKRVRYWVLCSVSMDKDWVVPEVTFMEVLERAGEEVYGKEL